MVEVARVLGQLIHPHQRRHALARSPYAVGVPVPQGVCRETKRVLAFKWLHPLLVEYCYVIRRHLPAGRNDDEAGIVSDVDANGGQRPM